MNFNFHAQHRQTTSVILSLLLATALLPSCRSAKHSKQNETRAASSQKPKPQTISSDDFSSKMDNKESFVLLLTHPSCRASRNIKARIAETDFDWSQVYYLSDEGVVTTHAAVTEHHPFTEVWPTLLAIENGKVIDIIEGPNTMDVIRWFVERHVHDRETPTRDTLPEGYQSAKDLLVRVNYNTPTDLEGEDLSRVTLHHRSFSGFNLKGIDFSDAKLSRISFSHADLTGARFDGATLEDIFWGDTICPDGTYSRDHDYTCHPEGVSRAKEQPLTADIAETGYVAPNPVIRKTDDGTIYLEDFLIGTAAMLAKTRKTAYQHPILLDKQVGYGLLLTHSREYIKPELKKSPESFDYYLYRNRENDRSFILTLPSNKPRVIPEDATMYRLPPAAPLTQRDQE